MKYRNPKKESDLLSMLDYQHEVAGTLKGINKLNGVIDGEAFGNDLEALLGYGRGDGSKGGRPPFDPVLMLKILVVQKYYGLSDDQTQYQIKNRLSFMQFLGLHAGEPDAKTIWDFRQLLDKDGRGTVGKLNESFTKIVEQQGMIAREGSIVDTCFVDAPRQRSNSTENSQIKASERPEGFEPDTCKGCQKDCDAHWVNKNDQTRYGYKNHAKVDANCKLVVDYVSTAANVNDSKVFEQIVNEHDEAVFADSAYLWESNREHLLDKDCQAFIMLKAKTNSDNGQRHFP